QLQLAAAIDIDICARRDGEIPEGAGALHRLDQGAPGGRERAAVDIGPFKLDRGAGAVGRDQAVFVVDMAALDIDPAVTRGLDHPVIVDVRTVELALAAVLCLDRTGIVDMVAIEPDLRAIAIGLDRAVAGVVDVGLIELDLAATLGLDLSIVLDVIMPE